MATSSNGNTVVREVDLMGRIDEVCHNGSSPEELSNETLLRQYLAEVNAGVFDQQGNPQPSREVEEFERYRAMYVPLGLPAGPYKVTGIEGRNFDGYVPGRRLTEGGQWVDAPENDQPWVLQVEPQYSAFDLMVLVANSEFNGYPHVNHVWFESLVINSEARTLQFGMGS